VTDHLAVMRELSGWLAGEGLGPDALSAGPVVARFVQGMRPNARPRPTVRTVAPVLDYLRGRGAIPEPVPVPETERTRLLADYRRYLTVVRGLTDGTVANYACHAARFLAGLPDPLDDALPALSAGQVLGVISGGRLGGRTPAQAMVPLRSLLRFLFRTGRVAADLSGAVPVAARWRLAGLPARLDAAAVTALLGTCDRTREPGARGYAVILLLARLGPRSGEVAGLALEDISWRHGTIIFRGKCGRCDELPLTADVGQALADYLRFRPAGCAVRSVFLTMHAPRRAMSRQTVASVIRRACAAAGIPEAGPHRLRHTLAGQLLAAGASLQEIGMVLGHRHPSATEIYAKIDDARLAGLARPWPLPGPGALR
jgi:site-specific recombinase XerD